jgi:DNA repair exonuclease SbcCD ATPase subunit
MYVDQMTSIDRLFRFDRFDSPSKRKAIGELLIGLSDFELYEFRVRFHKLDSMLDAKVKDIKTLHEFFGSEIKTIDEINLEIDSKRKIIASLEDELVGSNGANIQSDSQQIKELKEDVFSLRNQLRELEEMKNSYIFEISDSQEFVKSLNYRLIAINDSASVINALSDIGFHYCPACFSKVNHHVQGCYLCGSDLENNLSENDPTFKIRKEIEYQINESNHLIEKRQEILANLELDINKANTNLQTQLKTISFLETPIKEISQNSRKLLLEIGAATNEIDQLNEGKNKYSKLHNLYELRDELQKEVNELRDSIDRKSAKLEAELSKKKTVLSSLTLKILNADKNHEEIFREGKKIDFDFGEDKVSIDDRALFSASSMVYLKNAFRLALLEAACLDSSYIYPRFLLMDNVEDKGMVAERSHTFQKEIIRVSSDIKIPHQIIYTTSMIYPELDNSSLCVGSNYNDHNKTLKFKKDLDLTDI